MPEHVGDAYRHKLFLQTVPSTSQQSSLFSHDPLYTWQHAPFPSHFFPPQQSEDLLQDPFTVQHFPSTQEPSQHSLFVEHCDPPRLQQEPLMHLPPLQHCSSELHLSTEQHLLFTQSLFPSQQSAFVSHTAFVTAQHFPSMQFFVLSQQSSLTLHLSLEQQFPS